MQEYQTLVQEVYEKSSSSRNLDKEIAEYFQTEMKVQLECILSPYLLTLVVKALMTEPKLH